MNAPRPDPRLTSCAGAWGTLSAFSSSFSDFTTTELLFSVFFSSRSRLSLCLACLDLCNLNQLLRSTIATVK